MVKSNGRHSRASSVGGKRTPIASPSGRETPNVSRFKTDENVKSEHELKRVARGTSIEGLPRYMSETIASLHKRESFRNPTSCRKSWLARRRSKSVDMTNTQRQRAANPRSPRSSLEMISSSGGDCEHDSLENYQPEPDDEGIDVAKLEEEVNIACRDAHLGSRLLRRNSTGNSRRIEGGLSPLPSREVESSDEDVFNSMRPHSTTDLMIFQESQEFDRVASGEQRAAPQMPSADPDDDNIGESDLRHGWSRDIDSHRDSHRYESQESFDSTAAVAESPSQPRSLSPFLVDTRRMKSKTKSSSHLDQTVPQFQEIHDGSGEGETSDGSRGSAEARCHTGAAIPNSPPSGNYVQISEEKRGEIRRPSDIRQKPNISGSLILAGVFAGAAIIIGKIFSWKN